MQSDFEPVADELPTNSAPSDDPEPSPPTPPPGARLVLTKEQVFLADDGRREWVPCPEWAPKGSPDPNAYGVFVKALSGRERAMWQQASLIIDRKGGAQTNFLQTTGKMVQLTVVDENGKLLFNETDILGLMRKNSAPLERISDMAMSLSGIGEEEKAALLGNSPASLSDDSDSD